MGRPKLDKKLNDTFGFRVESAQKKALEREIEKVRGELNQSSPVGLYKITSSDIVLMALKKGLSKLTPNDFSRRKKKNESKAMD